MQEGPEKISVHGRHSRTTSSLEAYNCALNKRIRAKGNFYNFAQALIHEEYEKFTTVKLLIESAGGVVDTPERGVIFIINNIIIINRSLLWADAKIADTATIFNARRIQIEKNDLCDLKIIAAHADDEQIKLEDFAKSDSEDGDEGGCHDTENNGSNRCTICLHAPVLFVKCKHLCVCMPCYTKLIKTKKIVYNASTTQWYNDNELLENNNEPPPFVVQCVLCRVNHTEDEIITGIYSCWSHITAI